MNRQKVLGNRLLHMLILTAFVAVAIIEPFRAVVPMWEYVLGVGFMLVWLLGQRYERMVVVEAGLAERHEVREAERASQTWFPWN